MQTIKIITGRKVRHLINGRWRQIACKTPAEAVALRDRLRAELPPPGTLADAFARYCNHRGLAAGTARLYRSTWNKLAAIHRVRVDQLTSDQLAGAIAAAAVSPTHQRTLLKLAGAVLGFARDLGLCPANVAKLIRPARVPERLKRVVADAEFQAVRQLAGPRLQMAILLGRYAGLRAAEAKNLRWVDIDLDQGLIRVSCRPEWSTKSGRNRMIPIPLELAAGLSAWRLVNGFAPGVLDRHNIPWGPRAALRRAIKRAGVMPFRFHDLRVTYLSKLANAGVPMTTLAEIAGHASINTTAKYYVQTDMEQIRKAV